MTTGSRLLSVARNPTVIVQAAKGHLANRQKRRLDLDAERDRSIRFLEKRFQVDAARFAEDYEVSGFASEYLTVKRRLTEEAVLREDSITSNFDCQTMYLFVRASSPDVVVETGVFHGGFTAHILAAMEHNGRGSLYSIDLPKSGALQEYEGALVSDSFKSRWQLRFGDSRVLLPSLLNEVGPVDLFHHDSLHTMKHMRWEFETAAENMKGRGWISSHDVISAFPFPNAFPQFCSRYQVDCAVFRNLGLASLASPGGKMRPSDREGEP